MLGRCLLACLTGLGCGVANGLYLLLVLRATSVARGVWRKLLVASWLAHVMWPVLLVMFVVLRPLAEGGTDGQFLCFICSWLFPALGAVIWYMRTHPDPLQIRSVEGDQHDGKAPATALGATEPGVGDGRTIGPERIRLYTLAALCCGVGSTLYLLLSRREFLHYYLAAVGCGLGLALYLLIILHATRVAKGRWRGFLRGLWPSVIVLYFAIGLAFRLTGTKLELAGDYAAELGVPFLLGAPVVGAAIWYIHKHPTPGSTEPAGRRA